MSDLFDDDLLTEEDLKRLRPAPTPPVVTEEAVPEVDEPEVVEQVAQPLAGSPEPEFGWPDWSRVGRVVGPWMGPRQRKALEILLEEAKDGEWHWQQPIALRVAEETGVKRVSALRELERAERAGIVERRRDEKVDAVQVRLTSRS